MCFSLSLSGNDYTCFWPEKKEKKTGTRSTLWMMRRCKLADWRRLEVILPHGGLQRCLFLCLKKKKHELACFSFSEGMSREWDERKKTARKKKRSGVARKGWWKIENGKEKKTRYSPWCACVFVCFRAEPSKFFFCFFVRYSFQGDIWGFGLSLMEWCVGLAFLFVPFVATLFDVVFNSAWDDFRIQRRTSSLK